MGLAKSELFSVHQNQLASLAKVLGHPARIAILQHLASINTCICGDLVSEIGLAQPTISQHLKELKKVDLIKGEVEGTSVCYCINPTKWKEAKEMINQFFVSIGNSTCC